MKKVLLLLLFIILSCRSSDDSGSGNDDQNQNVLPKVTTLVPALSQGEVKFNGKVLSTGSGYYSRGFCWSLNANPTLNNSETVSESTNTVGDYFLTKTYASSIFTPNTTYHVRAYLQASNGEVVYGEDIAFVTLPKMNVNFKIAKQIYTTSATLSSEILVNLLEPISPDEKGICYKTSSGVDLSNGTKIALTVPDYNAYDVIATGLQPNLLRKILCKRRFKDLLF